MSELTNLQQQLVDFCEARDWRQFHNPKDVAISLVLEATEVLEHFQWQNAAEMQAHVATHREEISDELADVFYWLLLLSHDLKIDLTEALQQKMVKNEVRYPKNKAKGNHKKYTELQNVPDTLS